MFEIEFYQLPNGKKPVEEFLDSLDKKMRAKAIYGLSILEEYGNTLREPHSKSMGDGLFELRIKFAGDISRIFYFFVVDNKIILTNGFIKKTLKTPKAELDLARKYKADYERRQNCNE
ncbi:MAG: type II toxin-antitoxin system RelE/ParE family toxin [Firmicutes bacterium]|nr:type II toxin-antitoxin system RelE/ParE family toxin [Bacillota bacterium]MDY6159514.1 type II toxin-antitoxin system RelE/ParE family toxin [Candidatus Faecousia sp.]